MNVDLAAHRSRLVTAELLQQVDVAFVFDYENYLWVRTEFPRACQQVYPLGVLARQPPLWIEDPFGKDQESFRRTYEQIQTMLCAAQEPIGASMFACGQEMAESCPSGDLP